LHSLTRTTEQTLRDVLLVGKEGPRESQMQARGSLKIRSRDGTKKVGRTCGRGLRSTPGGITTSFSAVRRQEGLFQRETTPYLDRVSKSKEGAKQSPSHYGRQIAKKIGIRSQGEGFCTVTGLRETLRVADLRNEKRT